MPQIYRSYAYINWNLKNSSHCFCLAVTLRKWSTYNICQGSINRKYNFLSKLKKRGGGVLKFSPNPVGLPST